MVKDSSLRYKKKGSTRVYFTVASYWLIDDFTSMTRAAGNALKLYHTGELVLVARAINNHKRSICQQTKMVTKDPRPQSERSRRNVSSLGGSFFVGPLLKMMHSTTPQKR